ncbi:venom phosphodiesterase 2-like [Rhopilema esculentum]|uniref:venom phosphodiesterase 2-like n=1 Tax=Rhopilema esculentum TaxID=499914 RepID=UPI0031D950DF
MNRKKVLIIFLIGVAVVATVVGVAVGLKLNNEKESNSGKASAKKSYDCKSFSRPAVIMISMDGFRADYLNRSLSPNIHHLASEGVQAEYMTSQFPTKTFPNHYTIATGLYPESHGIVSNSFLSEDRSEYFRIGSKAALNSKWWKGEPIWNTVRRQGLKSASYFWVGSEVNIGGLLPNYWKRYNGNVPFEDRVDQVLKWLEMDPSERPNLLLTYFEEPDKQGHSFGPDSAEVNKAIKRVDDIIGRLVDGIRKRNLSSCVNIVMTSDHGMTNISCSRAIYLDKFISLTGTRVVGLGASSLLYTDNSSVAATIVQQLKGVKNLKAYLRDGGNLPNRLHYTNNKRIGDVVLIPDLGWSILERNGTCRASYRGTHGYDNSYADMRGIFVANGPAFKRGLIARPFENIEIYNLIAEILNVKPAPNNGTFGSLSYFLRKSTN